MRYHVLNKHIWIYHCQ